VVLERHEVNVDTLKVANLRALLVCRGGAVDSTDTNSYRGILDPYELRIILDHSTQAMHVDFSARISRISICLAAESIRTSIH
jgi:hypothetical protein